jgi:hypothetical protein
LPFVGAAVAEEVLGAGGDVALLDHMPLADRALQAQDHLAGIARTISGSSE